MTKIPNTKNGIISKYAKRIRLDSEVSKEFEKAFSLVQRIVQFRVEHVLVENEINERGGQSFPNFCFFGSGFYGEVSNIKEGESDQDKDIFVLSLKEGIVKVAVTNYANFDFHASNDKSQMSMAFSLKNGESFYLNAAGANCDVLLEIYRKYLMPRLHT